MTPITIGFVCLLAVITLSSSTDVNITNKCKNKITVIRTENEKPPVQECDLQPGQSCKKTYAKGGMNWKSGWNGLTLAEITFDDWKNKDMDFYDLSVIVGYDVAMQISTDKGGPTRTCKQPKCPEAYLFPDDNSKNTGVPKGGTFQIVFCP